VLEAVQRRLDENPKDMRQRRETVEHPFGTIKARILAEQDIRRLVPLAFLSPKNHSGDRRRHRSCRSDHLPPHASVAPRQGMHKSKCSTSAETTSHLVIPLDPVPDVRAVIGQSRERH
jgi:hypothetical protein